MNLWIVEDDTLYTEAMSAILESEKDIQVSATFEDAESLLSALNSYRSEFLPHVMLLDINLPGKSGLEVLHEIKTSIPETSVIMLTILEHTDFIFEAFKNGASGYLTKDAAPDLILEAIRQAQKGGSLMPPNVADKVLEHFRNQKKKKGSYGLTQRERDVLEFMSKGKSQKEIANRLYISPHTVNSHTQNIYMKLHVNSGIEAIAKALREKLI